MCWLALLPWVVKGCRAHLHPRTAQPSPPCRMLYMFRKQAATEMYAREFFTTEDPCCSAAARAVGVGSVKGLKHFKTEFKMSRSANRIILRDDASKGWGNLEGMLHCERCRDCIACALHPSYQGGRCELWHHVAPSSCADTVGTYTAKNDEGKSEECKVTVYSEGDVGCNCVEWHRRLFCRHIILVLRKHLATAGQPDTGQFSNPAEFGPQVTNAGSALECTW